MKSIFLSVVVICALAIAGIGGTLANFSDTELVVNNSFTTGTFDLKVWDGENYREDAPWGKTSLEGLFISEWICPEVVVSKDFWVSNQGTCDGILLWKIKHVSCENVTPPHVPSQLESALPGLRTEPELIEESSIGGWLDQQHIHSGSDTPIGDGCTMLGIIEVRVFVNDMLVMIDGNEWNLTGDVLDYWYEVGVVPGCGEDVKVTVDLRYCDIDDPNWRGDPLFAHHKTNAYQADKWNFNLEFGGFTPVEPPE